MFNKYTDILRQKMRGTEGSKPLLSTLRRIEGKIDLLVKETKKEPPHRGLEKTVGSLDVATLLSLPDHLRKSTMVIMKYEKAMAEDVAKETGRARAIESAYLNQLTRMGYIKKKREGRRAYFSIADARPDESLDPALEAPQ
jgi:DNA-binding transcriptional ArsR family regulator